MDRLKTLKELVALKSFSQQENSNIVDYLVGKFKPFSKEIIKIKNPTNENIT